MNSKKPILNLPDCACFNIRKSARVLTQHFDEILKSCDLRATQFSILAFVSHIDAISVSDLAGHLIMDRTTLTRNLRPLEKRGFIKTVPGIDRRTRMISLTSKGHKKLQQTMPLWEKAQTSVLDYLGTNRFNNLLTELHFVEKLESTDS